MNNEIKEILAYFEEYIKITDMHDSEPMLNWKDLKIVLDYINNLQEKYEEADNDRHILFEQKEKAIEYFKYQLENLDFYEDTKARMLCAMGIVLLQGEDNE